MPLYEYECPTCQKIIEAIQKFSDAPLETCPDCKGPIKKIMSSTSFALKGSGWYTTDYKKSGGGEKAEKKESK
jgi:putative FmdB family regulatory protein